ncbi:MAG: MMPL family transporter, partial [Planctomycetes bacterium]|nr:MMPL family transporter [Planctomycetota bacterium]
NLEFRQPRIDAARDVLCPGVMPHSDKPWFTSLALALAVGSVAAWFGAGHLGNQVDVTNRALKSRLSQEAHDLAALRRDFGEDRVLLLGFQAASGLRLSAEELRDVDAIGRDLAEQQRDVVSVDVVRQADPSLACLAVDLTPTTGPAQVEVAERVVDRARDLCPPTLELRATGQQLGEQAVAQALGSERERVVPMVALTLVALLWFVYRRLRVALVVLAAPGASIAITGGLFAWCGHRIDPVATLLDPVLLTVGVAAGVHLVEGFAWHRLREAPREAAASVRLHLRAPVLWTTITTMVGFFGLTLTDLPAVVAFGAYAAFGVALVSCLAFWCVPIWLATFVPSVQPARANRTIWIAHSQWLTRRATTILAVSVLVLSAAFAGLSRSHVDNDPLRLLAENHTFRRDHDWFVNRLGGVETVGIRIPAASDAATPDRIALLGADLVEHADVVGFARPPRRAENGDVLLSVLLAPGGSASRVATFDSIDARLATFGFPEVRVVGTAVQIARDSVRLVRGQLAGILLVIPLLGVVVALGLRSWRLGVLSLLPNAAPAAALYGIVAWLDRPLSVATVMIGSTMMGLVIDDTIHLMHHYVQSLRRGRTPRRAVLDAMTRTGRAISVTSVVLALGLGVGVFGSLESTIEFSALAAGTVVIAWLLDVVVLPATLLVFPFWSRGVSRSSTAPSRIRDTHPVSTPCPTPSTS